MTSIYWRVGALPQVVIIIECVVDAYSISENFHFLAVKMAKRRL
jgi:hypothetical protein